MYKFAFRTYKYAKMKSKTQRLMTIRKIIENETITSQEELLEKLEDSGYKVTQATLSRDLKFLRVGKVPDNRKVYVYRLAESDNVKTNDLVYPIGVIIMTY